MEYLVLGAYGGRGKDENVGMKKGGNSFCSKEI